MDSFLASENTSYAASIQKVTGGEALDAILGRRLEHRSEEAVLERQTVRTAVRMRAGQWLLFLVFVLGAYQFAALTENSFILSDACRNMCGRRILEYIHHKDGKKA